MNTPHKLTYLLAFFVGLALVFAFCLSSFEPTTIANSNSDRKSDLNPIRTTLQENTSLVAESAASSALSSLKSAFHLQAPLVISIAVIFIVVLILLTLLLVRKLSSSSENLSENDQGTRSPFVLTALSIVCLVSLVIVLRIRHVEMPEFEKVAELNSLDSLLNFQREVIRYGPHKWTFADSKDVTHKHVNHFLVCDADSNAHGIFTAFSLVESTPIMAIVMISRLLRMENVDFYISVINTVENTPSEETEKMYRINVLSENLTFPKDRIKQALEGKLKEYKLSKAHFDCSIASFGYFTSIVDNTPFRIDNFECFRPKKASRPKIAYPFPYEDWYEVRNQDGSTVAHPAQIYLHLYHRGYMMPQIEPRGNGYGVGEKVCQ